jgi:subtilase family serine protease
MTALRRVLVICAVLLPLCVTGQAAAQATPCADLQVSGIVFSPASPVQGEPASIAISIRNAGTCAAGGFVVQFKTDLFATTGPSRSVDSLAAGATTTLTLSFNFPQAGNFQTVVLADTGNAVSETNEVNNLEIQAVTVLPPGVNLVVDRFTLAPDPVVQGRAATATITVTNAGNAPAGAFRVEWSPFFLGAPLSRQLNGLAAGASTTVTFDFTFPFAATVDGTATVDSTNTVPETSELDNVRTLRTVVEPPLPNLAFAPAGESGGPIDVNPAPAGSVSTVAITVVNDGNDPAGDFVVRWQPWFFAAPLTRQVNGLAVGATATVSFDYTFPFAGSFDGTATIDSTTAVAEVDETDNTRSTRVEVPAATVDLQVSNLSISPSSPVQGAPATASVTVTNAGNSPSGRFVVDWNPDAFGIIVPSVQTLSEETGPLGPGASRVITFSFTYPRAGDFRSVAHVDSFNSVAETNEANNDRILNVTVQPAPIDLVFTGPIVFNPAQPVRGVNATATVTVRNDGPIATGPFAVQFKAQDADFFPQLQFVNGLNPGETRTLTFTTSYFAAGTFTATAVVDVFNQVVEPGGRESNNTLTRSVTVVPQSADVRVALDHLQVFNDLDPDVCLPVVPCVRLEGEWNPIVLAVFDPARTCHLEFSRDGLSVNTDIPSVACVTQRRDPRDDRDNGDAGIATSLALDVKLLDDTPLVAAVGAVEDDDPLPPDIPGFATFVSFRPDYLRLTGQQKLVGQGCAKITVLPPSSSETSGGHCFDAFLRVTASNVVGPAARNGAARTTKAAVAAGTRRAATRRAARLRRLVTTVQRCIASSRRSRPRSRRVAARACASLNRQDADRARARKPARRSGGRPRS